MLPASRVVPQPIAAAWVDIHVSAILATAVVGLTGCPVCIAAGVPIFPDPYALIFAIGEADPDRIEQVFANLLDNAIKFSDADSAIEVAAQYGDGHIEFQVRDQGDGIEAEAIERVFDLYEQAGDTVSRKQGTGIGLAIARYIVEEHGGSIKASSPGPGAGSTFLFTLPLPIPQVGDEQEVPDLLAHDTTDPESVGG